MITLEKDLLSNSTLDGWPSTVDMKVILPGLVHYDDLRNGAGETVSGEVLVSKEALDRMANSMEGKPIINWDHRSVTPDDYKKGRAQGIIVSPAVFNAADGWYHAKGLVWDEQTKRNIENGYSISCAYTVKEWGDGPGTHNQVPYLQEVKNGTYTHIAVVPTPRYDGARIELLNSIGGKAMGILNLFRKDKSEEKVEIDLENTVTKVGDKDVSLSDLVNSFKKANPAPVGLRDEDTVEIDGKKVTILELKNAHIALYNEAEKKDLEEKHNSGAHSTRLSNCAMCNAADEEDKKKKDEDERTNAVAAAEKKRKEEEELANSRKTAAEQARIEAEKNAARLEEMRNKGGKLDMPKVRTLQDQMADGEARYGVKSAVGAGK